MKKLICTIIIMALMSACAENKSQNTEEGVVSYYTEIDCKSYESNRVAGLPYLINNKPNSVKTVTERSTELLTVANDYYSNNDIQNGDLFKNEHLNMESKLSYFKNAFNAVCK